MIFSLGAMSFGSISYETHTTLATAMNKWVVVCFDSFKFLRQSGFVDLLVCIECNWSLLIIAILIGGKSSFKLLSNPPLKHYIHILVRTPFPTYKQTLYIRNWFKLSSFFKSPYMCMHSWSLSMFSKLHFPWSPMT